jgi:hypothetical protein
MTKAHWFSVVYGVILTVVTLAGIEAVASFFVPPWPARALRSIPVPQISGINSWGMNDRERTLAKPADVRFRSVFVGDSFVEFRPNRQTLTEIIEKKARDAGVKGLEAVGLGVSGTDPRSYYYRTRDVAFSLSPDAILLFFFSGNDFLLSGEGFDDQWLPPLVDESPGGSVVGTIMPRTDWLLVNRLRLSEFLSGNKPIPHEAETLSAIVTGPPERRLPAIVQHVKRYYFPDLGEERLTEILSRGGDAFWKAFEPRAQDQEYLQGWILNLIVAKETQEDSSADIRTPEDAAKKIDGSEIKATLSWLLAFDRLAKAHKVPIRVFVIPPATVAPDFVEFWKPWPRYLSWYVLSDVRHQRFVEALDHAGVPVVDLRKDLLGVPGTFRMSDAHWTEKGLNIAAQRVFTEMRRMMPPDPPAAH